MTASDDNAASAPPRVVWFDFAAAAFGCLGGLIGGGAAATIAVFALGMSEEPAMEAKRAEAVAALQARIAALEARPAPAAPVYDAAEDVRLLRASLDDAGRRLGALEPRTMGLADLERRLAVLEAAQTPEAARIAALERRVERQTLDRRTAYAVALATLQSAMSRGAPFVVELAATERAATEPQDSLVALRQFAAVGVPTAATLRLDLPALSNAAADALAGAQANGALGRLIANAQSAVRVRPTEPADGSAPSAILSRIDAALAAGEAGRALGEWERLPDPVRAAAKEWSEKLRARALAERALTALTAALGPPPTGQ